MKTFCYSLLAVSLLCVASCGTSTESKHESIRIASRESAGFDSRKLATIDSIITAAVADSAFPGAQVCIAKHGLVEYNKSFGRLTYAPNAPQTSLETMYDCASLTKVIATTSAIMKLFDEKVISLDDKISQFIPQFGEGRKSSITIRHLLTHSSGLPPFRQLWKFVPDSKYAVDSVYATPLVANPGDTTIYSDLGFITLGKVVEKVSGKPLDRFVQENFFEPLGMTRTMFTPPTASWGNIAPTEHDTLWRKTIVQGIVHDENADFLGGVSGHAGLFSTATDLSMMMQMLMNGGTFNGVRYLESSTVELFTKKQSEKSSRALGWDTKSPTGSSAGKLFSPNSFGHTGFTGTSIWVDPERQLFVILLTNRVHPTRANLKIAKVRPAVADAVIEALAQ